MVGVTEFKRQTGDVLAETPGQYLDIATIYADVIIRGY